MPSRVARLRLAQAVENQFDTSVVAAFEAILASADEEYKIRAKHEFQPGSSRQLQTALIRHRRELVVGAA